MNLEPFQEIRGSLVKIHRAVIRHYGSTALKDANFN